MDSFTEPWRLFWAKTNREKLPDLPENWTHPLWAHLIDVANTALILWERFLPATLKQRMADALGMTLEEAGRFLSIWIGLHDLGKAIPGFQQMHPYSRMKLEEADLKFYPNPEMIHHGHASIAISRHWLTHRNIHEYTLLEMMAACVGIHHGKLCKNSLWETVAEDNCQTAALGDATWKHQQRELAEAVCKVWEIPWPETDLLPVYEWPDWLMAFAGWATLADWLGSMQSCFVSKNDYVKAEDDLRAYLSKSRSGAEKAFRQADLHQQACLKALSFEEHFGFVPRNLQETACDLKLHETAPNLIIVEGPTGEGKTEGALYLSARLQRGLYIAMPSQATSDGLFPRLREFIKGNASKNLKPAHQGNHAALRLIHGNDLLHEDAARLVQIEQELTTPIESDTSLTKNELAGITTSKGRVLSWFLPKKRALLVPYGVGTVDQLLLGTMYARHFFLRLFALAGKTIVFDEVHAYDMYMNQLFLHLLRWLRVLDAQVIILSATLPDQTRQEIIQAWEGNIPSSKENQKMPYPILWHVADGCTTMHPFNPTDGRHQRLSFRWCAASTEAIIHQAKKFLAQGATVMIICNKVKRAQEIFAGLDDHTDDRMLLHARMPQAWRKIREQKALERFGKKRPDRSGLLVGTQVIEQSLDLDADVMITDLAPIDLLLQRAGRLHRHQRSRPQGFTEPVLYIACNEAGENELPDIEDISGKGKIYFHSVLWKTWAYLRQVGGWALPQGEGKRPGYRELIEAVYGDMNTPPLGLSLQAQEHYIQANQQRCKEEEEHAAEAIKRLVPKPDKVEGIFCFEELELVEEDETSERVATYLQASTRNPDGIGAEVLLLHRTTNGWSITQDGSTVLSRDTTPLNPEQIQLLFGASLRLSDYTIIPYLWKTENPEWQSQQEQKRILKRFYLIELIDNQAMISGKRIRLDNRLGVIIE